MAIESKLLLYGLLAAMLAIAAHPIPSARADDLDDQARERYQRAIALYEDGVYDAALVELRRAYELRPSYKLLYNLGQVRLAMRDYAGALETFQQYLREGASKVPGSRREAVQKELTNLEQRVGQLSIRVDLDGAEVLVDDAPVGRSPLRAAVLVNSGLRRITATHPERPPQTLRVSIAGGERQEVSLTLGAPPPPAVASSPAPRVPPVAEAPLPPGPALADAQPAKPGSHPRYVPWLSWGATGALGLTAVGLAVGARLKDAELADARSELGGSSEAKSRELDALKQQTQRFALATDILLGATAAAAGVSLLLTLRKPPERDDVRGLAPSTTHVALSPSSVHLRTEF